MFVKTSWLVLACLHVMPAAVLFSPRLTARLYAVDPMGDVALLLRHRGAMFLGVLVACTWALFDVSSRRLASAVVTLSMASFLLLYLVAGRPEGALKVIAQMDLVGLVPLVVVLHGTWRPDN